MSAKRVKHKPPLHWAIWWQSDNDEHFMWANGNPLLFATRRAAMEYIRPRYGYILTRKDLRAPPYNWRLPKPVRVEVVLKEAK